MCWSLACFGNFVSTEIEYNLNFLNTFMCFQPHDKDTVESLHILVSLCLYAVSTPVHDILVIFLVILQGKNLYMLMKCFISNFKCVFPSSLLVLKKLQLNLVFGISRVVVHFVSADTNDSYICSAPFFLQHCMELSW